MREELSREGDGNFEKIGKLSKKEEIDMKRRRVNNGLSPMR